MKNRKKALVALGIGIMLTACGTTENTATNEAETNNTVDVGTQINETSQLDEVENMEKSENNLSNVGTGDVYSCDESEAHAITASGEDAVYDNVLVNKTGDSEGDESDFYGTNAAVYADNGANLTITNSKIVTDGSHANAVFSYGEDTVLNISDSVIETSQNNSGGIMVTGGGTLNAENLYVTTQGGSSAAIRSDRGGGTMNVSGGNYKSYGSGSPAIYSTADVNVSDAELYSDKSQAVVVEGKNSVKLENVNATGKNTVQNSDNSTTYQAVMIYQSMSGDADTGEGSFSMTGGSLTSLNGGMFFVTNTVAQIELNNVTLNYATDDLLRIEKAGWGNDGSNGGQVNFNALSQKLDGVISVDEISSLNLYLNDESTFEGSIISDGQTYVEIDENSGWKLTADSTVSGLSCDADAIDLNGFTLTVGGQDYAEGTESSGQAIEFAYSASDSKNMQTPTDANGQEGAGAFKEDGTTPPDMPEGNGQGGMEGDGTTPPDMPEENGQGGMEGDGTTPPDKPDGNGQGGMEGDGTTPPDKPEGDF